MQEGHKRACNTLGGAPAVNKCSLGRWEPTPARARPDPDRGWECCHQATSHHGRAAFARPPFVRPPPPPPFERSSGGWAEHCAPVGIEWRVSKPPAPRTCNSPLTQAYPHGWRPRTGQPTDNIVHAIRAPNLQKVPPCSVGPCARLPPGERRQP